MNKKSARKLALSNRKFIDNIIASKNCLEAIINSKLLDNVKNIGIYYPLDGEIDLLELMDKYPNKSFYLPITKENIEFVKYEKNDLLVTGPYNTKEPVGNVINRNLIECFIIPCVAISSDNKRIGYGKGYYDRYLSGYEGLKIGVCYKEYTNLEISTDDYDIKLNYVIKG